jgi:hypothetical protein
MSLRCSAFSWDLLFNSAMRFSVVRVLERDPAVFTPGLTFLLLFARNDHNWEVVRVTKEI